MCGAALIVVVAPASFAQNDFNPIPRAWKWTSPTEVVFSYDGTYSDSTAFSFNASNGKFAYGVSAPEKYADFPVHPDGAVNMTYSPDSTMIAFTRDNDLYVVDIASGRETRLTFDGTDLILNGYASWVYYEEIFGRATRYKAFWWSPDSKKIGFYRFDNTQVPLFPIYSPFGQDGTLIQTRYPKAGEKNPEVRIGMVDLGAVLLGDDSGAVLSDKDVPVVWADFDPAEDQYFGIPFWSRNSREFFIARMPRVQNTLDLYAVSVTDGSKRHVYHEYYPTWLNWISNAVFTTDGMYMVRSFETPWEQIYFLSYDGELKCLTDGENWQTKIEACDETTGDVFFTSKRDCRMRTALYRLDNKGYVTALTDTTYNVDRVTVSPDSRYFVASVSNVTTPSKIIVSKVPTKQGSKPVGISPSGAKKGECTVVADMASVTYDPSKYALPELVWMTTEDGFELPGMITYPKDFDPSQKYPVHVDIYGGPGSPQVRDRWAPMNPDSQWWSENGIIELVADARVAGHNGRAGTDMAYRNLIEWPVRDFVAWADYLKSLPYVNGDKIGVEGFSFGGSMTAALLFLAPESYHYGVAGGGVYDWMLYDSHYTERFMDTPQNNPDGYEASRVLNYVSSYPTEFAREDDGVSPVMLKITHGTGDDNVHFQNTMQLVDELQKAGKDFELMIYPDGMHGYRGYQAEHFDSANHDFWLKYLKN